MNKFSENNQGVAMNKDTIIAYSKLMRLHRPIGIYLVLWPTLWALWLAAEGIPSLDILAVFVAGAILMRSAGCVINDFADRKIDGEVKRTKDRPMVIGLISPKQALLLFALLCGVSFLLVLMMNTLTIYLSVGGVVLAALYPFMKRYTYLPQVFLGAAFAWAVPMAYAAETNSLPSIVWLVYMATLIWTVAYDTMYAMVDRDDDLKIGVKSTAILFGNSDRAIIAFLQVLVILTLCIIGQQAKLGQYFFLGIVVSSVLFVYQQHLIRHRDRDACFKAFLNNNWVGLVLFCAIFLDYAVR
jgi:4-hydroxybenzoate polyprenyltransferase